MEEEYIYKLETNIDDCSGEVLGYVMDRLFEAGARDVHYIPVYMKKNRPGWQLNIVCDEAHMEALEDIVFEETTTIGIRRLKMERRVLKRNQKFIDTIYGEAQVKVCQTARGEKCYPEYESAAKLARANGESLSKVYQAIVAACDEKK